MSRTCPNIIKIAANIILKTMHQLQCLAKNLGKKLNFGRLPNVVINLIGNVILVKKNLF